MSHGPMRCFCCGEEETRHGCVMGILCQCSLKPQCVLCQKCLDHHHRNCTPALREQAEFIEQAAATQLSYLRKAHHINLFDYGERKEEVGLFQHRRLPKTSAQ